MQMKNMLVTGGSGFIGTNFIRFMLEESDFKGRIINVDKLTYAGNPENLKEIAISYGERYLFEKIDICQKELIQKIFEQNKIDSVCHFAAETHVDRSIVQPDAFIQTNLIGTFNLLEVAREYKDQFSLFHHVGTDEVFGSLGKEGYFTENTPYKPNSPYAASKAGSDHLVRAYFKTYQLPVTISNCSNNYGPYQFPEKLIPLMILNAEEMKTLPVYGDGQHVRDWLFVNDHGKAIWEIMKHGQKGEAYNIGGHCEMQNIDVVRHICDKLDLILPVKGKSRRELISYVKDRPGHDRRYAIDFEKIKNELNWHPEETFETGLDKTIRWNLDNQEWIDRIKSGEYQNWIKEHYN